MPFSQTSVASPVNQRYQNSLLISGSAAAQIKQQRRRYANVVLTALARAHRGRPTSQVQQILKTSLKPLGVRLSEAELHELAVSITAGRPVQLPNKSGRVRGGSPSP